MINLSYVDKSQEELKQRLIVEWKNIPLNYLKKITGNMPKRLRYIIEVKGYKILIIVYVDNFQVQIL